MIIGGESNDIEEFKEGDRVVFFKTDCGCGRLPVSLKELEKMTNGKDVH